MFIRVCMTRKCHSVPWCVRIISQQPSRHLTHCLGAALPFQATGTAAPCPRTQQPDAALHLHVGQHRRNGICH